MKKCILLLIICFSIHSLYAQDKLTGAWETRRGDTSYTMIIVDDYLAISMCDTSGKHFFRTLGGTVHSFKGQLSGIIEFDSQDKTSVGLEYRFPSRLKGNILELDRYGKMSWIKVDDADQHIAGNWRITQREQNGKLSAIHTSGPRKTIKILSTTRFQWAAINTETGEFSGTGGGRYTFQDGKYTEHILFFSRDASRVGMSLTFNARVEGKDWYHSGKSSKGDPINEVWSRN
jgi:hypothetical protein